MALVARLANLENPKISTHAFYAMLVEMSQGEITKPTFVSHFGLSAAEETELDWLIGKYNAQATAQAKEKFLLLLEQIFILSEEGLAGYTTTADVAARINRIGA